MLTTFLFYLTMGTGCLCPKEVAICCLNWMFCYGALYYCVRYWNLEYYDEIFKILPIKVMLTRNLRNFGIGHKFCDLEFCDLEMANTPWIQQKVQGSSKQRYNIANLIWFCVVSKGFQKNSREFTCFTSPTCTWLAPSSETCMYFFPIFLLWITIHE